MRNYFIVSCEFEISQCFVKWLTGTRAITFGSRKNLPCVIMESYRCISKQSWQSIRLLSDSIRSLPRTNYSFFPFTENVSILGSDDMTTCIIVVIRHSGKYPESPVALRNNVYRHRKRSRHNRWRKKGIGATAKRVCLIVVVSPENRGCSVLSVNFTYGLFRNQFEFSREKFIHEIELLILS